MAKAKSQQTEVHEYQAEMQRLLDILVHSHFTPTGIFSSGNLFQMHPMLSAKSN